MYEILYDVIIPLRHISLIAERPEVLVALLKRIGDGGSRRAYVTYDELATECGYANRSGVWKYINKLEAQGIVTKEGRGCIYLNLKLVV